MFVKNCNEFLTIYAKMSQIAYFLYILILVRMEMVNFTIII